jgi:hypothetical protein
MARALEAEDVAAALLLEGRACLATQEYGSPWPASVRAASPLGVLASVWFTFPRHEPTARRGYAQAKLALERRPGAAREPTTKAFDDAVASLLRPLG